MFGFPSGRDKPVVQRIQDMMSPLAASGVDTRRAALELVREVKYDIAKRMHPSLTYDETMGSKFITVQEYMRPRLAEGLRENDILQFWNRPQLLALSEIKLFEFLNIVAIDVARQQGQDLLQFVRGLRRKTPQYGDTATWDRSKPANQGLSREDADLYVEFAPRVGEWQRNTPDVEKSRLVDEHSSFNALVRHLVLEGSL